MPDIDPLAFAIAYALLFGPRYSVGNRRPAGAQSSTAAQTIDSAAREVNFLALP